MEDRSPEMMIQHAKAISELKMRQHYREQDELEQAAFILSGEGNRKQRRAFEARNRRNDK